MREIDSGDISIYFIIISNLVVIIISMVMISKGKLGWGIIAYLIYPVLSIIIAHVFIDKGKIYNSDAEAAERRRKV